MEPINYMLGTENPVTMAMKGYSQGLADTKSRQGILAGAQNMDVQLRDEGRADRGVDQADRRLDQSDRQMSQQDQQIGMQQQQLAMQQQEAAIERQKAQVMQADLAALAGNENATAEDYAATVLKHPELSAELNATWGMMSAPRQQADALRMAQVYSAIDSGDVDVAERLLTEQVEGLRNAEQTQDADMAEAVLETLKVNPDAAKMMTGLALSIVGGGKFDSVLTAGRTPIRSSDILPDGTTIVVRDNGTEVIGPDGTKLEGQAAADAIRKAQEFGAEVRGANANASETGTLTARVDLGAAAAGADAAGKKSIDLGATAYESYGSIRGNIANIQEAVAALDAGGRSGAVDKYLVNTSEASARLSNSMDRMGLDVISGVTFGALSEGELKLAMETAVPRNLNEADLRSWLLRKQTAQEKAAGMMLDAAQFLSTPGNTLADWIAKNRGNDANAAVPQQAATPAGDVMSDDDFNAMMGGN
tara:strand:+ start:10058 stop:11488 length:1431 start_codon:yes stop_codon:yes gene_type:complete